MNSRRIDKAIMAIVGKLVSRYRPERIILFGSYADGNPRSGSDMDILIIKKTKKRARDRRIEVKKILDTPISLPPVDAIVMTPAEIRRRLELTDDFIRTIMARGRVLYDKENA